MKMLFGKFQGLVKLKKHNRYSSREKQIMDLSIEIPFLQHIGKHVYCKSIPLPHHSGVVSDV